MNGALRHVVIVLLGCFAILFAQLNWVQVVERDDLRQNPANTRTVQREFNLPRAEILTSDGVVIATTELIANSTFPRQRIYPEGELYAHTVGYTSFTFGSEGAERTLNDEIVGLTPSQQLDDLTDLLDPDPDPGTVVLTLDHGLQSQARQSLGARTGSVVVLDAQTGAVLAMWSFPSFDPNRLATNSSGDANAAFSELRDAEGNPLRAAAFRDRAFPGSTFKVITAAALLEEGVATPTDPIFPETASYTAPLTERAITNFTGGACGGDLTTLLVRSCNTPFAQLAVEQLGPEKLVAQAGAAGFNTDVPFDLPGGVQSVFPTDYGGLVRRPTDELPAGVYEDTPILAQTAIGQNEVQATPLLMALMIAGVANDGEIPTPHVLHQVIGADGRVIDTNEPGGWRRFTEPESAAQLQEALLEASRVAGTAAVPGIDVGVKTGTAQRGTDPPTSDAWVVAFAGRPGEEPELAIAVLVEALEGEDQTGGRVAGPIAADLIAEWFSRSS